MGEGEKGDAAAEAIKALRHLGVFFYRDNDNSRGLVLKPTSKDAPEEIMDGTTYAPKEPIKVYNFMLEASFPIIRPLYFAEPKDRSEQPRYEKHVLKHGDAAKWLRWNDERMLRQVNTTMVSLYS